MVVEISKEQKEMLSKKLSLCVDFIKNEVQPHMVANDKISFAVGSTLELVITSKEMYLKNSKVISLVLWEPELAKVYYLEKQEKSKKKKYVCDVFPELAVEFLKNWEKAKEFLLNEVSSKKTKEENLNSFINDFKL